MKRAIDKLGRLSIPAEYRKELGLELGDEVNIECHNGCIEITNPKHDDLKQVIIDKLRNHEDIEEVISMIEWL